VVTRRTPTGVPVYVVDVIAEQVFPTTTVKYENAARTLSSTVRWDQRQCRPCVFVNQIVWDEENVCENCGTSTIGCSTIKLPKDSNIRLPAIHTRGDCSTSVDGRRFFLKNTHECAYGRVCHSIQVEGESEIGITTKKNEDKMRTTFYILHLTTKFGPPRMS
jgi:hypothetical protein